MPDTFAVVQAEERLNQAHSAAAMATRDHSRAIAYARRELAHALRLQEGPPEAEWLAPSALTAEDRETLHAAALAVGIAENTKGTPMQSVELLRLLPDNLAAALIEHWSARADEAYRCREQHHEGQIEQLRDRLNEVTTAHECWTHSHPREDVARG